jgi:hypothetical protein
MAAVSTNNSAVVLIVWVERAWEEESA